MIPRHRGAASGAGLLALAVASSLFAEDEAWRSTIANHYHYDPKVSAQAAVPAPSPADIIVMPKVTVVDAMKTEDLDMTVAREDLEIKNDHFSLVHGGTLAAPQIGNLKIPIHTEWVPPLDGSPGGISLLKMSF